MHGSSRLSSLVSLLRFFFSKFVRSFAKTTYHICACHFLPTLLTPLYTGASFSLPRFASPIPQALAASVRLLGRVFLVSVLSPPPTLHLPMCVPAFVQPIVRVHSPTFREEEEEEDALADAAVAVTGGVAVIVG